MYNAPEFVPRARIPHVAPTHSGKPQNLPHCMTSPHGDREAGRCATSDNLWLAIPCVLRALLFTDGMKGAKGDFLSYMKCTQCDTLTRLALRGVENRGELRSKLRPAA